MPRLATPARTGRNMFPRSSRERHGKTGNLCSDDDWKRNKPEYVALTAPPAVLLSKPRTPELVHHRGFRRHQQLQGLRPSQPPSHINPPHPTPTFF
ncbi:hypothetical protein DPEC_G00100210 [Dallia pectoralis]|uniref:Uncharacterized protein n=1 Tax=Dallia pectoralis TaxID=75939 RepID=A0ACC2GWP3_DALPE|nr:hypothetical protein DPEC_G00100210 [Dallia pectoralis]